VHIGQQLLPTQHSKWCDVARFRCALRLPGPLKIIAVSHFTFCPKLTQRQIESLKPFCVVFAFCFGCLFSSCLGDVANGATSQLDSATNNNNNSHPP